MSDILTATITLTDSTVITLGDGAIASGSWSFKKTAGSGGFEMGGAAISSCNFTILDQAGNYNAVDFENADVVAEINGVDYWKGYIKTATQAYNKIVVTAYDKLALADERKISMYSNSGEFPDNPPTTRSDLATFIATNSQFGIGLSGISGLANGSSVIPKMDKDCTFRQAIAYIAEAGGQFAYVDTVNNTLCFAWYDFNSNLYTPANIFGRNLSRDGTTISYVNVITYDGASAQMEPPFSNDGLTVEVSGNPCVTTDTLSSDVSIIESALVGTEFISGTLTVGTDMSLNVGRVIPVSHHGRTYGLPVASITYKPNNTMVIGCNDVSNMKMSFKSGSTMNSPGSDYRKTSYQQALDDAITNRNSKLAQALAQGGGGSTVSLRRILTNGTQIAGLTIDNNPEEIIYSPPSPTFATTTLATTEGKTFTNEYTASFSVCKAGTASSSRATQIGFYSKTLSLLDPGVMRAKYTIWRVPIWGWVSGIGEVPPISGIFMCNVIVPALSAGQTQPSTVQLQILDFIGVKPSDDVYVGLTTDNTTKFTVNITFLRQWVSVNTQIASLNIASTQDLGGVKVDGSDLSVDGTTGLLSISQDTDSDVYDEIDDILNGNQSP